MPLIKINMVKGKALNEKRKVAEAVHKALVTSIKVPEESRNIRINEYEKDDYILSPGNSEEHVLIEISLYEGRTIDAKRSLYKNIIDNLGGLGVKSEDIYIILHEEPLENWGIRGGQCASDVNLGFKVNV